MIKKYNSLLILLLFFWEFLQNILGFALLALWKIAGNILKIENEGHRLFIETHHSGISLGWFIFWTPSGNRFVHYTNDCRMHEYGHALQSVILGPLYLPIVGVPSIVRNLYGRFYKKKYGHKWENYFNGFPENWADKLGGLKG